MSVTCDTSHSPIGPYLDRVVEFVSEDFGEIAEILNRHKTLKSANEDLKTRQKDTSTENEEKRAEFTSNVKVCLARTERCNSLEFSRQDIL